MPNAIGRCRATALVLAMSAGFAHSALADILVSTNDGHSAMDNGAVVAAVSPKPDTFAVIDITRNPPKLKDSIEVPGSVVGPPMAVWLAPDESWAIVTASTRLDASAPTGMSGSGKVSVIDLTSSPPKVTQQLDAADGASSVRVSPDGKLALVTNRNAGSVSLFDVNGKSLAPAGTIDMGKQSAPGGVVFTRDGKYALVTRGGDHQVSVLQIDGNKAVLLPRPITTGLNPYTIDINAAGTLAAVSNMGRGDGDVGTVSLIDLTVQPFRVVDTIALPDGPEPLKFSPDGKFLAVGGEKGTVKARSSPFYGEQGSLTMVAVTGKRMKIAAATDVGGWLEGVAFSRDGKTVFLQEMGQNRIGVFRWNGKALVRASDLEVGVGPSALATGWP